jgi:DNA topoisomerase I
MSKNLVIVESPAKAKTIKKYLGKDFDVLASFGHVRDLVPKEGAVDPDNQFAMNYQAIDRSKKHVDAIKKALTKADTLYLAPDPDREGEAIAWHLCELLRRSRKLKGKTIHRVAFNEITKKAVQAAIKNPREIAMDLVNAQQARRALDYLVGFNLSPLLWRKIRRGLSAGRVQSPALRLIAEREIEIEKFQTKEYWSVTAALEASKTAFSAKLVVFNNKKLAQFSLIEDSQTQDVKQTLLDAAKGHLTVTNVEKKQRKRNPAPPFTTSTLQQEAARKLGFTARRTMQTAQQLYEGVEINGASTGLITYMRTDSVNLAQDALIEIRDAIAKKFGKENLPDSARYYKTKSKNAQEAHEAIRPTLAARAPADIQHALTPEQFKLYSLIWKRALACQMIHATIDTVAIDLSAGIEDRFRASGSTIANPGFISVYQEGTDDEKPTQADDERLLPAVKKGDVIDLNDIITKQHFTEPPPRYSEASLVKTLEEHGIGRPSTYASIISTLLQRAYVVMQKKRFYPTDVGRIVNKFLTTYFTNYVDYDFTAQLENTLDAVARGEKQWIPVLDEFWRPFAERVKTVGETVKRSDVTQEEIDEKCPKCDATLSIRLGRNGRFIGCTKYPDCDYTRNLNDDGEQPVNEPFNDYPCPECEGQLIIKAGRYGKFIGCSNYPKCKHLEPLEKPKDTGVTCPKCQKGTMLERKSRKGKVFFACSAYPKCRYAVWNKPVDGPCPKCNWPILTIKTTKLSGTKKLCPQADCDFSQEITS